MKRQRDSSPITTCCDCPPFIPLPESPILGPPFPLKPGRIHPEVRFLNTTVPKRIRALNAHSGDKERDIPMSQLRGDGIISVRVKFYEGTIVDDAGPTMDIIELYDAKEIEFQLPLGPFFNMNERDDIIRDIEIPLSEIGVPDHAFGHATAELCKFLTEVGETIDLPVCLDIYDLTLILPIPGRMWEHYKDVHIEISESEIFEANF